MNATHLLVAQHRAIEALFAEVACETRRGPRTRAASRLTEELIAHMAAEATIFYPAARSVLGSKGASKRDARDLRDAGERMPDEHFMLRAQLRRVLATNLHTPAFTPRFEALRMLFANHVESEEEDIFPRVEALLPARRLEELGTEVEGARPPIWLVTTETQLAPLPVRDRAMGGIRLPSLTEN
jgi:hemerythrin superfamily protein